MKRKRMWLPGLVLLFLISLAGIPERAEASSISIVGSIITATGDRYAMNIDVNQKTVVESFVVDGTELLPGDGNLSTQFMVGGTMRTSRQLGGNPTVQMYSDRAVISYGLPGANEVWTVRHYNDRVELKIDRTFTSAQTVQQQGLPVITFGQDVFENIRWQRSGSNFWIGGKAAAQRHFLAGGSGYSDNPADPAVNIRRAMEDTSFTLLSGSPNPLALTVTGTTNRGSLDRGAAIEVDRFKNGANDKMLVVNYNLSAASADLQYATGSAVLPGWPQNQAEQGRVRPRGNPIYQSISVGNGETQTIELTFQPDTYSTYFDLGTLNGVDEQSLSEVLNSYGRQMVLDWNAGVESGQPTYFFQLPALAQHYQAAIASIMRDDRVIEAAKNGLRLIKDRAQADDGHIRSPYVGDHPVTDSWGSRYYDSSSGFAMAIADIYSYTNDMAWITEMRAAGEKALDHIENNALDTNSWLLRNQDAYNPKLRDTLNDIWEKSTGAYNGYTSAMYYEALTTWAQVERVAFGDTVQAAHYEQLADRIKEALTADLSTGGLWNGDYLMYGSANPAVAYLPPNASALHAGLLDKDRIYKIVDRIERETANFDLRYHMMNIRDIRYPNLPAPQALDYNETALGENGGWYGAPAAEYFAGLPVYGDRNKIPFYIDGYTWMFDQTGFVNASTYLRDGVTPADYGWVYNAPDNVLPVWALYAYGYGFQPSPGRLTIAPFISDSMVGSQVKYRWAQQDLQVTYNGLHDYTLAISAVPGDMFIRFINQTPSASYTVSVDGVNQAVTADVDGNVEVPAASAGSHRYILVNPNAETARSITGNYALGKPVRASSTLDVDSSTLYWPEQATDGIRDSGAWFAASSQFPASVTLDIGGRANPGQAKLYFARNDLYSFTIRGSNNRSSWTTLAAVNNQNAGPASPLTVSLQSGSYQYYQVNFTGTGSRQRANLRELELGSVTSPSLTGAQETPDYPVNRNVAYGKPVTFSSDLSGFAPHWGADKAVDGSIYSSFASAGWSSWSGAQHRTEWIRVDLGQLYKVNEIRLYPGDPYNPGNSKSNPDYGNFYPVDYKVQTSVDGSSWTDAASVTGAGRPDNVISHKLTQPVKARYVRVYVTEFSDLGQNQYFVQLAEIEVMSEDVPERNLAQTHNGVQASSWVGIPEWSVSTAVDGIEQTVSGSSHGWSSAPNGANVDEWIVVDLGQESDLSEFQLWPRSDNYGYAFPVDYKIQVSSNAAAWSSPSVAGNWTTVLSVTDAAKPTSMVRLQPSSPATGRYVRLYVTKARNENGQFHIQLAEFEAWGRKRDANISTTHSGLQYSSWAGVPFWEPDKAVDGTIYTVSGVSHGWSSQSIGGTTANEWLALDLGQNSFIGGFLLWPRSDNAGYAFPVDYRIQVSNDAAAWSYPLDNGKWTTVVSVTDAAKPTFAVIHDLSRAINARYVRLWVTKVRNESGQFYSQLAEFEVMGSR